MHRKFTCLGRDNRQIRRAGDQFNRAVAEQNCVLDFAARDGGIPSEGLIIQDAFFPCRSCQPLPFPIAGGASLVVTLFFTAMTEQGICIGCGGE